MCEISYTVRFKEANISKPLSLVSCFEAHCVNDNEKFQGEQNKNYTTGHFCFSHPSSLHLVRSRLNDKNLYQGDPSKTAVHPMLGSVRNTARKPKAISYIFNTDDGMALNVSTFNQKSQFKAGYITENMYKVAIVQRV